MSGSKRWLLALLVAALMSSLVIGVSAQGSAGTLALGQPLSAQIEAGGTITYDYSVTEPTQVTLEGLSANAQPTLAILSNGAVVAQQTNTGGAATVTLTALLNAGSYTVQVGTTNNTAGTVILVLQSAAAITTTPLTPDTPVSGIVDSGAPLALYTFNALSDQAFLFVKSDQNISGVNMRLINTATGQVEGQMSADLLGGRFRIPGGSAAYRVEVQPAASGVSTSFTVCVTSINANKCELGASQPQEQPTAVIQPPQATPPVTSSNPPTAVPNDCLVSASVAGAINIRQSASTLAIVSGLLPNGAFANVIGMSPDKTFYNVLYNGLNGWISVSVVTTSGDCSAILTINPPPIIPQPTAVPVQPTQPPPPPTASGPCTLTVTAPTYIYKSTNADPSNLFDQVQPGGQVTPQGRLADNSWWQVMEYGYPQWVQTSTFGHGISVSGNCSSLPIVSD